MGCRLRNLRAPHDTAAAGVGNVDVELPEDGRLERAIISNIAGGDYGVRGDWPCVDDVDDLPARIDDGEGDQLASLHDVGQLKARSARLQEAAD